VGDKVNADAPLFYLDDRDSQADLAIKRADLLKAQAQVRVAQANLNNSQSLEKLATAITDKRAISGEELLKRHNAVLINQAEVDNALAIVQQASASVANSQTTLERLVVRSPIKGEVLQVNVRAGEFANAGASVTPLLLLGNLDAFHVRVDIDENDAWRFDKTSKAVAYLRGNRDFKVELKLAYVEPFVIPKKSLTGDSTERVDTRVLQALYSFDSGQFPIYIGQQMDVFIEAREVITPRS
jgi:multidrug resistance efflux pump